MKLRDKVAVITGAGAGIGRVTTLRFVEEGARVAAIDLDAAALQSLAASVPAGAILPIAMDVSLAQSVRSSLQMVLERFGTIHILFNNVGIVPHGKLHETSEEEWQRVLAMNVTSAYLLSREVIPIFLRQGGGVILNMSSATVLRTVPDRTVYSASKAAVLAMSRGMALDYVRDNIRVNCLCPGTIDTPSLRERLRAFPDPEEARARFIARQPMGRFGSAEEVAAAAVYLASDEASFVTGVALPIDGGFAL